MIASFRSAIMGLLLAASLTACSSATDASTVDLNGRWVGRPGVLGVESITLDLVERNKQLTGSGTFTSYLPDLPSGTVTLTGLRIADALSVTLTFNAGVQTPPQVLSGVVEDENHFHLVFPGDPDPVRARFQRQ